MRHVLLTLAGFTWITSNVAAQPRPTRESIAPQVDSLMARLLSSADGPPSVSVAVVRGRDTLVMRAWGLADREGSKPATTATSYRIGSVTKQFTAALVLRLVDQKRVALSDTIGRFVQGLPAQWRGLTIQQLLNHTSGIPDIQDDEWRRHWPDSMSPAGSLARVAGAPMKFAPGSAAAYSNANYKVLGMLVEALYGASYAAVVQREIATPLGLVHTRYCEDPAGANGQALGYSRRERELTRAPYQHTSQPFAAGGLCSTAGDMARWNAALHAGSFLSAESYRLMTTPQGAATAIQYGFGLFVEPSLAGTRALVHNGGLTGFQASNGWFQSDSLSVTVLSNTMPVSTLDLVMRDLAAIALGQHLALGAPVYDQATLRRYTGRYLVQLPGRTLGIRVSTDGDKLIAQPDGQSQLPLRAVGDDTFDTPASITLRLKFVVENGAVTKGILEQRGRTFDMLKQR